ncbi:MAG: molybdopterin molybdotransferase MoeA [Acidobacteriota bacterium]|nr:molybdopterin molybdotransferase MoeA [Acidobacteriota bacterium]
MRESEAAKQPIEFEEAREIVIQTLRSLPSKLSAETVALEQAHGRILAKDAKADRDYPALRRSLRDGFAVRAADLPGTLRIRGEVRAGDPSQLPLAGGEALEIMTGAPVPEGADAVVMIEHVAGGSWSSDNAVTIERTAEQGQFINGRGTEAQAGSVLISAGTRIDASHIASLAMIGSADVEVFRRPKVAILATGDEIVALEETPESHQIRNSNSYMLASLVRCAGGVPTVLSVARDTVEALRISLEQGLEYDLLLISGGVSAGKYDLVKPTLRELGVTFHFERVRIQPGQPTTFGTREGKAVFGLPGNPGSSLITFQLFARPAIELLAGESDSVLPLLAATFEAPFRHKLGLTRFLPARLTADGKHLRHIPWQGSSDVPALAKANAFLVAEHDRESWKIGDSIRVMLKP